MGLPWIGFAFGCTLARALKQPRNDIIAIAIETGIQNTGMSIFILWFTLDHPLGDITAVVPVAAATMTPFPLLAALIVKKLVEVVKARKGYKLPEETLENGNDLDEKHKNILMNGTTASAVVMDPKKLEIDETNFHPSESNQKLMA